MSARASLALLALLAHVHCILWLGCRGDEGFLSWIEKTSCLLRAYQPQSSLPVFDRRSSCGLDQ